MLRKLNEAIRTLSGPKFAGSYEWPHGCDGHNKKYCPEIRELIRLFPHEVRVNGCAHGLVSSRDGLPILKLWRIQTNCARMQQAVGRRCPGPEVHPQHGQVRGKVARESGKYTTMMAKMLIKGLCSCPSTRRPEGLEKEVLLNDPAESTTTPQLLIATLHSNLGHPSSRALA